MDQRKTFELMVSLCSKKYAKYAVRVEWLVNELFPFPLSLAQLHIPSCNVQAKEIEILISVDRKCIVLNLDATGSLISKPCIVQKQFSTIPLQYNILSFPPVPFL